jgi:hypothetical protein
MKVSLLFVAGLALTSLSNTPANAEPRCWLSSNIPVNTTPSAGGPCPKIAKSYAECIKLGTERGWDSAALFYACNTQGYKN